MSCPALQLSLRVDVLQMEAGVLLGRLKQFRHVLLRKPHSLTLKPYVNLQLPIFSLKNEKLAARRWLSQIFHS